MIPSVYPKACPWLCQPRCSAGPPRILIFRVATIQPPVRFRYRAVNSILRGFNCIGLNEQRQVLTMTCPLSICPSVRNQFCSFGIGMWTLIFRVKHRFRHNSVETYKVSIPMAMVFNKELTYRFKYVLLRKVICIKVSEFPVALRLPYSQCCSNVPYINVRVVLMRINQTLSQINEPLRSPLTIRKCSFFTVNFLQERYRYNVVQLFISTSCGEVLPIQGFLNTNVWNAWRWGNGCLFSRFFSYFLVIGGLP